MKKTITAAALSLPLLYHVAAAELPSIYKLSPQDAVFVSKEGPAANTPRKNIPALAAGNAGGVIQASEILPDYWQRDALKAYDQAIREKKLLALFFTSTLCPECQRLAEMIKESKLLSELQSCMVFVLAQDTKDAAALAMSQALSVKTYPSVSFILPSPTEVYEVGKILGYTHEKDFLGWTRFAIERTAQEPDAPPALAADPLQACKGLANFPAGYAPSKK